MNRVLTTLSVALAVSCAASAKDLHTPSTQELIGFQAPSSAEISPDGRFVADCGTQFA
jgi:hypothetical protein